MSAFTFEFINTTFENIDRDVQVKNEPHESEKADDDNKCGEVHLHFSGNFIFVCGFCHDKYDSITDFGVHLKEQHEDILGNIGNHLTAPIAVEYLSTKVEDDHQQDVEIKSEETDDLTEFNVNYKPEKEEETAKTLFTCKNCGKSFKYKGRLQAHQSKVKCKRQIVDAQKPTSLSTLCSICNKHFKSKAFLKRHIARFHEEEEDNEFVNWNESVEGLSVVLNNIIETVGAHESHVDEDFSSNETEDIKDYVSDTAPKPTVSRTKKKVKVKQFPCISCVRTFKSKTALKYHTSRHHDEKSPKLSDPQSCRCKYCNQEFQTKAQCTEHEGTHIGEKRFICWYCPHTFRTNYGRKRHMRVHTGERPFKCTECPKAFPHMVQLDYHIRKHKNLREFSCQTCGKAFYRKFELSLHERRHTGFRPIVCEDCGKTFNVMSELNEHRKRHTDVKDWKCEVCGKGFYSKSTLKDHMAGHSGKTPFSCDVCGRKFSRSKALKKHEKLHSDVKAYVCSICGKAYAQDSGLYAHKKTHGISKIK